MGKIGRCCLEGQMEIWQVERALSGHGTVTQSRAHKRPGQPWAFDP